MAKFTLFTQPGLSGCQRTTEFLSDNGFDFIIVDVRNDPNGMERLSQLVVTAGLPLPKRIWD